MRICIDPGHSGPIEPGACAEEGKIYEAEIVMQVSRLMARTLELQGHEVVLTREGDILTDDLGFRCDISNKFFADIFISVHCNGFPDITAHGTEVWHFPGSAQGEKLASFIQTALIETMGTRDRGIKEKAYDVLRDTQCPAVIVELAFISNVADRLILTDTYLQRGFAQAVAIGVEKYQAALIIND